MNIFISEAELARRVEHNKNINDIPEVLKDSVIHRDEVLINLFAYEKNATGNSKKLVELQYKNGETAGGRTTSVISQDTYQARGVITKKGKGPHCDMYNVGDIVWLNHRALFSGSYDLLLDREVPVAKPRGVVLMPAMAIQIVEKAADLPAPTELNDMFTNVSK